MVNETASLVLLEEQTVGRILQHGGFTAQEKINITDGLALVTEAVKSGWIPGVWAREETPVSIATLVSVLDRRDVQKLVVRNRAFVSFGRPRQRDLRKFADYAMQESAKGVVF